MSGFDTFAWRTASGAGGKRTWFVARDCTPAERAEGAPSTRYVENRRGQLRRFASREAADKFRRCLD